MTSQPGTLMMRDDTTEENQSPAIARARQQKKDEIERGRTQARADMQLEKRQDAKTVEEQILESLMSMELAAREAGPPPQVSAEDMARWKDDHSQVYKSLQYWFALSGDRAGLNFITTLACAGPRRVTRSGVLTGQDWDPRTPLVFEEGATKAQRQEVEEEGLASLEDYKKLKDVLTMVVTAEADKVVQKKLYRAEKEMVREAKQVAAEFEPEVQAIVAHLKDAVPDPMATDLDMLTKPKGRHAHSNIPTWSIKTPTTDIPFVDEKTETTVTREIEGLSIRGRGKAPSDDALYGTKVASPTTQRTTPHYTPSHG